MEQNFDLGMELAGLLSAGVPAVMRESNFNDLITSLRPYLTDDQNSRLNRAMELAGLMKSAKTLLPKIGGALGVQ